MPEPLISAGAVRKLWVGETELYRQHLLRLYAESRRHRFGGAVSDEFIRRYSGPSTLNGAVIYGFFVEGVLRGAAELRLLARAGEAEAASASTILSAPEISGTALARRSVGVSSGATRSAAASFAVVILYLLLTRWSGAGRAVLP